MKSLMKYILLLVLPTILVGVLVSSCDEEDDNTVPSSGNPKVLYIRATNPTTSDSLVVGAFMGALIAIVGEDLGTTKELWFNDQRATLTPTYITNKTILVSVPSTVPKVVTNKMRFVFRDGKELLHDFAVNVPKPVINSIKSEYVPEGGTAVIYGDFFFTPVKVKFQGDVEGVVTSVEKTQLTVTVPKGANSGAISVTTNFGTGKSNFLFRDDRNVLLDFDTKSHESWTAPIAMASSNPSPAPCSGNYAYIKNDKVTAWMWVNGVTMQYWAPRGRGNVPVAKGLVNDLVLRFEANVPVEWKEVRMEIFFGPYAEDHGRDVATTAIAWWKPWKAGPYKTDGWVTVSIPLTDFVFDKNSGDTEEKPVKNITNLSSLTNITMMIFGPAAGSNPVHVCFDNVRIVPK
jgi:hypothetical protein